MSSPGVRPLYLLSALSMATQFGIEAPITVQGGPGYAATDFFSRSRSVVRHRRSRKLLGQRRR